MDKKTMLIGILLCLIVIMAVAYAILSQQLKIQGTASVESIWDVRITNIEEKEKSIGATTKSTSYNATTANFNVGFTSPGDYAIYEIEVSNLGTLDAIIKNINFNTANVQYIKYTLLDISEDNYLLKSNEKYRFSIKVEYKNSATTQPSITTNSISVIINCVESRGGEETTTATRDIIPTSEYKIGDLITYAGSDWYVIKNSNENEDYVTLLKKTSLTHDELKSYGMTNNSGTKLNSMAYYWSDTCHYIGTYGRDVYTTRDYSGCTNHNDYAGSKIKEFLEGTYINTLGASNLKEVDGYKIRLIKKPELINQLGFQESIVYSGGETLIYHYVTNVPTWVYKDFGETNYWSMTTYSSNKAWIVYKGGDIYYNEITNGHSVRPVINLLKSAIE